MELQVKGVDIAFTRQQFDTILSDKNYACMAKYLAPDADIVLNPAFESGVVKIINGAPLTPEEAEACVKLRRKDTSSQTDDEDGEGGPLSALERLEMNRKRRKLSSNINSVKYIDAGKLICATSNCCERLFSEAKYIMVPNRRGMSPIVFESLLFLKKNARFWDIKTVAAAMRRSEKEDEDDDIFDRDDDAFYQ